MAVLEVSASCAAQAWLITIGLDLRECLDRPEECLRIGMGWDVAHYWELTRHEQKSLLQSPIWDGGKTETPEPSNMREATVSNVFTGHFNVLGDHSQTSSQSFEF